MKFRSSCIAGIAAALTVLGIATTPAQAGTTTQYGCPSGAVCMYTDKYAFDRHMVSHAYYQYGYHPLYNEFGTRIIFNNQHAWSAGSLNFAPGAYACPAATGSGCISIPLDQWRTVNITPINYIRLTSGA